MMSNNLQKMFAIKQSIQKSDLSTFTKLISTEDIHEYINQEDASKKTLIFYACIQSDQNLSLKFIDHLIDAGADLFHHQTNLQNVLYYLANMGKEKLIRKFLQKGFKEQHLNNNDYMKQSPLFYAAAKNHLKCAEIFIKHGANVDHRDYNSQSPIFYAASKGNLQMCKLLVNRNANFALQDANRETPLHYARKNKQKHVSEYLGSLKKSIKKQKDEVKMESSQQESRGRKKKEMQKQQFCLVYTNQDGYVHQLSAEELIKFANSSKDNERLYNLMNNPEKLDTQPLKEDKKFQKLCLKILTYFQKHQQGIHFAEPLDIVALNIPHYINIVKHPMDFSTIKTKLSLNAYGGEEDFCEDMHLVFDNCILFNGKDSPFGKIAFEMKCEFDTLFKKEFP